MRAVVPDGRGSVRLDAVDEPRPEADEAVVAVEAFSVNRGETLLLERPVQRWRPGKDVAGTVVTAAADGTGPAVGSRVVGHAAAGGWAERAAVPAAALAELPDDVPATLAAALPLAGLTALRLLRAAGPVTGRRLLVTGASGGVGHYLTELAVNAGAAVTALSATAERGARLRALGAETVTRLVDAEPWYDAAFESLGGQSLSTAWHLVRPEGRLIWFGQATGEPAALDFFDWVAGGAGAPIVHFHYAATPATDGADLHTLVRLVADGRLHPELGTVAPWQQTAAVVTELRARRIRGNAVLEVAA
jgi:NADPH:quinone reductase-like Zn-dependent oxidoreductase